MIARRIARWRVPIGFLCAALVLWLATPTWLSLGAGAVVTLIGEALRVWAAGHVEKSREVTSSGPYRVFRHPLYVGSSIIGAGIAIAAANLAVALIVAAYLGITLTAAMRAEEAHLREKFGTAYDDYARGRVAGQTRAFSLERAVRNREHHAMAGVAAGLMALAGKIVL